MPKRKTLRPAPPAPEPPQAADASDAESRRALVEELVEEIRKDSLKEEALRRLEKRDWPKLLSAFFRHPATLLVIGFALTGLVGSRITSLWQSSEWDRQKDRETREWERQQQRLVELKGIDLKYGIIEELTKALSEHHAAAKAIRLPLMMSLDARELARQEEQPIRNWAQAYHDWLVSEQIIRLKLTAHVKNQEAVRYFDEIAQTEKDIRGRTVGLQNHLNKYNLRHEDRGTPEYERRFEVLSNIEDDIDGANDNLRRLVILVADEARADVLKSGQP